MNIKAKKAKKKLQEIAKKTAKDIGYELGEIPKRAPSQLVGKDVNSKNISDEKQVSPIVEAMKQKSDSGGQEPTKQEKTKFIKDKARVDEEIEERRKRREELERVWREGQKQVEEDGISSQPGQPLEIPTSKPSRGRFHPGKKKSAEKRLGKK